MNTYYLIGKVKGVIFYKNPSINGTSCTHAILCRVPNKEKKDNTTTWWEFKQLPKDPDITRPLEDSDMY